MKDDYRPTLMMLILSAALWLAAITTAFESLLWGATVLCIILIIGLHILHHVLVDDEREYKKNSKDDELNTAISQALSNLITKELTTQLETKISAAVEALTTPSTADTTDG